jgi:hypothetical protein
MFDILFAKIGDGSLDMIASTAGRESRGKPAFKFGEWLHRGRVPADRAFAIQWLTDAVDVARLPVHEQPAAIAALPELPDDNRHILSRLLLPAVDKFATAYWRNVAEARCAVVAIACERFRLKHGGWPAALADLCPEFLPAVPLDPFDGQPLRFAKQNDGVIVHSVGPKPPSARDEAEAMRLRLLDKRNARPGFPQDILCGFRLWNPDARRLPPPPDPPAPEEPKDEDKE